jgi:hypothetical protein
MREYALGSQFDVAIMIEEFGLSTPPLDRLATMVPRCDGRIA